MFDFERLKELDNMANTDCRQASTLVFIENQEIDSLYEPDTAFGRGTVFPELDKPLKVVGMV